MLCHSNACGLNVLTLIKLSPKLRFEPVSFLFLVCFYVFQIEGFKTTFTYLMNDRRHTSSLRSKNSKMTRIGVPVEVELCRSWKPQSSVKYCWSMKSIWITSSTSLADDNFPCAPVAFRAWFLEYDCWVLLSESPLQCQCACYHGQRWVQKWMIALSPHHPETNTKNTTTKDMIQIFGFPELLFSLD